MVLSTAWTVGGEDCWSVRGVLQVKALDLGGLEKLNISAKGAAEAGRT